jgi:ABC-type spermidine/putrescine transport system permease subunit I
MPTLIAAGLLCFVTAAGEYVASELLFSARTLPVSKAIEMLYRSNFAAASALSVCLMGLSLLAIGLGAWLTARRSWRVPG